MKKVVLLMLFVFALAFAGCGEESPSEDSGSKYNPPSKPNAHAVPPAYQGNWLYAYSGAEVYLGSETELILEYTDPNIITEKRAGTNYHLVRAASSSIKIFGSLANLSTTTRAIGGLDHIVDLINNDDDRFHDSTETDDDGNFMFDDVPNGSYQLDVDNTTVDTGDLNQSTNDIGVITLADGCNIKSSIVMNDRFVYGNNTLYQGKINITNVGDEDCLGLGFDISPIGDFVDNFTYNLQSAAGTIEPNRSTTIPISISFKHLDTAEKVITLNIVANDVKNNEWQDRVSLVVFRSAISIDLKSISSVRGYIAVPDYGLVGIARNSSILVPELSEKDYMITLSNPSVDGESFYSIGVNTPAKAIGEVTDTVDGENNNTSSAALIPLFTGADGYLHKGDIDTFKINVADADTHEAVDLSIDDNYTIYEITGNSDGLLNKGESAELIMGIINDGSFAAQSVVTDISTTDNYVTLARTETYCGKRNPPGNSKMDTNGNTGVSYLNVNNYGQCFTVTTSNNAPDNHIVVISVTMTDMYNNVWTDELEITVVPIEADLSVDNISRFYDTTGNNDGFLNKGESAGFDVGIYNGGSSSTQTVVVTLAEDDEYINITKSTSASYCATLNILGDSKMDTGGNYAEYYLNQPNYPCFTITALNTAPDNHVVTIAATMTDKYDNVWIDEFEIEIVPTEADLSVDAISRFYDTNGNGDGFLNRGESAGFDVGIYNGGSSSTQTVVVTLAEDDEYINITKSTSASYCATLNILGDSKMDTGGNSAEYYLNQPNYPCFTVTALTTAPDNHMVTVTATMTDKYNNVWIDEFEIEIVPTGAKLIVDGIKISGDGSLNKGESVKFNVGIYNEGTSSTQSVVTTLATDDDYVTVVKNISGCSNISLSSGGKIDTAGYTGSSYLNYLVYPCFTAIALGTTPDNHIATVTAIMTDKYNNVWTDDFEMMVLP